MGHEVKYKMKIYKNSENNTMKFPRSKTRQIILKLYHYKYALYMKPEVHNIKKKRPNKIK